MVFERKVGVLETKLHRRIMSLTSITVLSFRVLSFANRSLMILMAGSIGTEVNKADTS